jgi:hypothetical protein
MPECLCRNADAGMPMPESRSQNVDAGLMLLTDGKMPVPN